MQVTLGQSFGPASSNALKTIPLLSSLPKGQSERLYGTILVIAFLLRSTSPGSNWINKITELIGSAYVPLSLNTVSEMGFPADWRDNFLSLAM